LRSLITLLNEGRGHTSVTTLVESLAEEPGLRRRIISPVDLN
jgi:hypothetical protein